MRLNLPKPLIGSSQNNICGSVRISEAKVSRLFSPPEMLLALFVLPILVFLHFTKLNF